MSDQLLKGMVQSTLRKETGSIGSLTSRSGHRISLLHLMKRFPRLSKRLTQDRDCSGYRGPSSDQRALYQVQAESFC